MDVTLEKFDAAQATKRIRLIPLEDLKRQAFDPPALREWILERACRELCSLYWPIPWDMCAFSGPGENAVSGDQHMKYTAILQETRPEWWQGRPSVRYVRIAPKFAEQFRTHGYVEISRFPDGLIIPDDVTATSGLLEATTFSAPLRVSDHKHPAPPVESMGSDQYQWDCVRIGVYELYVDEGIRDDVREFIRDSSSSLPGNLATETAKDSEVPVIAPEHEIPIRHDSDTVPVTGTAPTGEQIVTTGDPYKLKERSDGVYMLYRTAERCALNPEFISASKAENDKEATAKAKERKKIALETFNQLLGEMAKASNEENQLQRKLQSLFGATRLNYALHLIDPGYNHNNGRPAEERGKWPPAMGEEFLAQPDARRQGFVTPMLALIIGGAEYWLQLATEALAGRTTKQQALQQWLEDHGLTGRQELETAFAVIAWKSNVDSIPTPPKFAIPSTSRGRPAEGRPASRRRT